MKKSIITALSILLMMGSIAQIESAMKSSQKSTEPSANLRHSTTQKQSAPRRALEAAKNAYKVVTATMSEAYAIAKSSLGFNMKPTKVVKPKTKNDGFKLTPEPISAKTTVPQSYNSYQF